MTWLIGSFVIIHAVASGYANFDRGGDRGILTPDSWIERQVTGVVYYVPLLGLLAVDNGFRWFEVVGVYLAAAALTIASQSLGRGSYGDAATMPKPDNESLRHVLDLFERLREAKDPKRPGLIVPNPLRDATGLFLLGLIMGLPGIAAAVYLKLWLGVGLIALAFASMPVWYFANNVWFPATKNWTIKGEHISVAELSHGAVIGLSVSAAALLG